MKLANVVSDTLASQLPAIEAVCARARRDDWRKWFARSDTCAALDSGGNSFCRHAQIPLKLGDGIHGTLCAA